MDKESFNFGYRKGKEVGRKESLKGDEMEKIKNIYDGELIEIWEDEGYVYTHFLSNGCTLSFPKDMWVEIKAEIIESDEN